MNLEGLNYSKTDSFRRVTSPVAPEEKRDERGEVGGIGASDTDYSKGEPHLETAIVFILSGGSEREKDYFRPLRMDAKIRNVKIAFRSKKGQGLKPYELASIASEFLRNKLFITEENLSYHIEEGDTIYLIQDVDMFGPELRKHLSGDYDKSAIQWIISNPAFEIWLFYHYHDNPSMLNDGLTLSERDRSNWLKENLNIIIPGGVKPTQALHYAEIAIRNSRNNYSDVDGIPEVFSTQMHLLAESVIEKLGDAEYKAMNERRNARIAMFKSLKKDKDLHADS